MMDKSKYDYMRRTYLPPLDEERPPPPHRHNQRSHLVHRGRQKGSPGLVWSSYSCVSVSVCVGLNVFLMCACVCVCT